MAAGLYVLRFVGAAGFGGAVLYVGNGIISGMDAGGIKYDGSYSENSPGVLSGSVTLIATTAGPLVTGQYLNAGQSVTVPVSLPSSFSNGQVFQFSVAGKPVPATFEKLRDLP